MALLNYEMIEQIRGVADAYERTERKRLERVSASEGKQESTPSNVGRNRGRGRRG